MIEQEKKDALRALGFTHIALDEDGLGWAFWSKPVIKDDAAWLPVDPFEDVVCLASLGIVFIGSPKPWRDSLEEL